MKKLIFSLLTIVSFMFLFSCKVVPKMNLKPVFVESGTINADTTKFLSNGDFKTTDSAIGTIDTVVCGVNTFNGYITTNDMVYVFAGGKIPASVKALSLKKISQLLQLIPWTNDFTYKLLRDAEFCMYFDKFQYYVREKGETIRQKATLLPGITVYRFKNATYLEDYIQYANVKSHLFLTTQTTPISFFTAAGVTVSNSTHKVFTDTTRLKINPMIGLINYTPSLPTILHTTDKVYVLPNSGIGQKYRFRVVYIKHDADRRKEYFSFLEKDYFREDDVRQKTWNEKLKSTIIPQYLEKTIRGYNCVKCNTDNIKSRIAGGGEVIPPLPIVDNGF